MGSKTVEHSPRATRSVTKLMYLSSRISRFQSSDILNFLQIQEAPLAGGKRGKAKRANCSAMEAQNGMAQLFGNTANLAVAAFPKLDLEASLVGFLLANGDSSGLGEGAVEGQARSPLLEGGGGGLTLDPNAVGFGDRVAGVGEAEGEVAIIGEQEGTGGVVVQATDGVEAVAVAQIGGQVVQHCGATLGIGTGGDNSQRLMEQDVQ